MSDLSGLPRLKRRLGNEMVPIEPSKEGQKLRVIVAGTRSFRNYDLLCAELSKRIDKISVILSGAARGADMMAEVWAFEHEIPVERYPADWEKHGKRAGYIRNKRMADNAEAAVLFWDGVSPGTAMMLGLCRSKRLPHVVIRY